MAFYCPPKHILLMQNTSMQNERNCPVVKVGSDIMQRLTPRVQQAPLL